MLNVKHVFGMLIFFLGILCITSPTFNLWLGLFQKGKNLISKELIRPNEAILTAIGL